MSKVVNDSSWWLRLKLAVAFPEVAVEAPLDFIGGIWVEGKVIAGVFFEEDRFFTINLHL